jgi:hypothetical protein
MCDRLAQLQSRRRPERKIRRFDSCSVAHQPMPRINQAQRPAFLLATASSLKRLVALRRIEVLTQAMVLVLAVAWLKIPLEVAPMMAVIALLAAVNLLTRWRLDRGGAASEGEVFAHLAIDVAALGVLLYFAGGSANPFVSLFLLPPTLAAAMLPAATPGPWQR